MLIKIERRLEFEQTAEKNQNLINKIMQVMHNYANTARLEKS